MISSYLDNVMLAATAVYGIGLKKGLLGNMCIDYAVLLLINNVTRAIICEIFVAS